MKILVTGGAGYIGSHTCVGLVEAGYEPVIYDDFSNACDRILPRITNLCGRPIACIRGDILDRAHLSQTLASHRCDAVIHFAGVKSVAESHADPLKYFNTNVAGTLNLLESMRQYGVHRLVFSSSATVYGPPQYLPYRENHPRKPASPYGESKLMVENLLQNLFDHDPNWAISNLRYFNPVGAHASGLIGENPLGPPDNLMPFISQVAVGRRKQLSIFGDDYKTRDGTGVRDYIHVSDLAAAHIAALEKMSGPHFTTLNVGTGRGVSVLEMVNAFEQTSGREIPYQILPRRSGDIDEFYADPAKAEALLGWAAVRPLEQMCRDAWNWQINNPNGY